LSASRPPARMTGTPTSSTMRRLMLQSCVRPSPPICRSPGSWIVGPLASLPNDR
jgi:hypothetical protein